MCDAQKTHNKNEERSHNEKEPPSVKDGRLLFLDGKPVLGSSPAILLASAEAPTLDVSGLNDVTVVAKVRNPGGDSSCSVASIVFLYGRAGKVAESNKVSVSVAQKEGVVISMNEGGYYSIWAYGLCQDDQERTALSYGVTVFASTSGPILNPKVKVEVPVVVASFGITNETIESFNVQKQQDFCDHIVELSGYNRGRTCGRYLLCLQIWLVVSLEMVVFVKSCPCWVILCIN